MKIFSLHIAILLIAGAFIVSCSDDKGPFQEEFVNYDIVQLTGGNKTDGTTFGLYLPESNDPITYTDPRGLVIDTNKVAVGDRLMLGYIAHNGPYVDGVIEATGYTPILNDTLVINQESSITWDDWHTHGIYVYSIYRMGPFINVHGKVTYSDSETSLQLIIDGEDIANSTSNPELYLVYSMSDDKPNFQRNFYASFDISALWANEWCREVVVNVNNINLPTSSFVFSR